MKVVWSSAANIRVSQIFNYYLGKSETAAKEIIKEIFKVAEQLGQFSQMAALEPLLSEYKIPYRSIVVRQHFKIIYSVDEQEKCIKIATVWDCRQHEKTIKDNL